jgi:hypothetical protein
VGSMLGPRPLSSWPIHLTVRLNGGIVPGGAATPRFPARQRPRYFRSAIPYTPPPLEKVRSRRSRLYFDGYLVDWEVCCKPHSRVHVDPGGIPRHFAAATLGARLADLDHAASAQAFGGFVVLFGVSSRVPPSAQEPSGWMRGVSRVRSG